MVNEDEEFNIFYKVPVDNLESRIGAAADLSLTHESSIKSGSFNQLVILSEEERPLLLSINEGSSQPFNKSYQEIGLSVQQLIDEKTDENEVLVTFQDQEFTLKEGDRIIRQTEGGEIEFILITSYVRSENLMQEGQQYFVRLYAYAL